MRPPFTSVARVFSAALAIALGAACTAVEETSSSSDALSEERAVSAVFAPTTKRAVIEIDYAPGAEPFTEPSDSVRDPWSIFRDNAGALLGAKELVVPSRLADMERLDDVTATKFRREDLVAIAERHQDSVSQGDTVTFYIVFLAGYFEEDDGTVLTQATGVSLRGTNIVALFKPAITAGLVEPATPTFMEQSTLVHEFGHAVGLVDRGLRPTTPHHDLRNGAHCKNPACIMYWENVLVKDGVDFVDTYLRPRKGVLFGPECINDARAFETARR